MRCSGGKCNVLLIQSDSMAVMRSVIVVCELDRVNEVSGDLDDSNGIQLYKRDDFRGKG